MVFGATFNNISVLSWRSVLLVEQSGENHWPVTSHWQTLSHNVVHLARVEIRTHKISHSGDMHWLHIGSCKSNYHTITATSAPYLVSSHQSCHSCSRGSEEMLLLLGSYSKFKMATHYSWLLSRKISCSIMRLSRMFL
jgi:hypothetical protein